MPQHWFGRARLVQWRVLVGVLALAFAAGQVQPDAAQTIRAASRLTPEAAARLALNALPGADGAAVVHHSRFGGNDRWQTGTLTIPAENYSDRAGHDHAGHDPATHDHSGLAVAQADYAAHGPPRVFLYLAWSGASGWTAAIEGTEPFAALAARARQALAGTPSAELLGTVATAAFTTAGSASEPEIVLAAASGGAAALSLPWARGRTWRITGGPHPNRAGTGRPWSALDFAGPRPGMNVKVRAARGGFVVRPCANLVVIRHGDGWSTSYYHLKDIAVRGGQRVGRGAFLGLTSRRSGCGGSATGPHVHFALMKNGTFVNIRGHALGGWTVREGAKAYAGCLVKNGVRRCAPNGSIYNDGSIGD